MVDSSVIVTTIDIPYSLSLWGMFLSCKLLYCVNLSTVCVHVCSASSVVSNFLWPMDCSPPGSSVHGILWARILEWVAMLSSKGSSQPRDWTQSSCVASIAGTFFTTEPPGKPCLSSNICFSAVFVQSLSRVRLFVTPMDCSMPSFPVLHYLSEFSQTHVPWVGDAIHPSHPLSSPPPAFRISQYQDLFQWVSSLHQVIKVLEL